MTPQPRPSCPQCGSLEQESSHSSTMLGCALTIVFMLAIVSLSALLATCH